MFMEKQSANPEGLAQAFDSGGADERSRTLDLLITNELLYQLSYIGVRHEIALLCRADLCQAHYYTYFDCRCWAGTDVSPFVSRGVFLNLFWLPASRPPI